MKTVKIIALVLSLTLLLCGCGLDALRDMIPEKTYTHEGVSINLPSNFIDYSTTSLAEGKDFVFANDQIGVMGLRESKEDLYSFFGEEYDAQSYANLIAELYELGTTATEKDGFWNLSYTQEVDGTSYTYLCVFHETASDFWNIQAYCSAEEYANLQDTLWKYATTVQFTEN